MNLEEKIELVVNKYKLKEIALHQIHKYCHEYSPSSNINDITEGYIQDEIGIKVFVGDAISYNYFLEEDERKYDLYILKVKNNRLYTFYREEYGDRREIRLEFDNIKSIK